MSTDELLREREETASRSDSQPTSRRDRLVSKFTGVFSPRYFLLALVALSVGLFTPSLLPIISALPGIGLVGLFGAAFALGGFRSERHYLETGVAGATAVAVSLLTQYMTIALVGSNVMEFATVGFGVGMVVAVLGYYFGRDLRDGVTRDIE
ncbi:hypothetical protein [Halocatena pleomorpha]|uniref:DUF5518 domain-containing protein n=1 Tax=Halocatena pleomorpha TaxID=1785090 RepID=A0A3P3RMV5_9EURY|nr:hypothetical protein [Halocatena pleomorpha]RRJ33723.1 hypothetical protein EIK79_02715 [Halocatena pleomorpha]